MGRRTAHNKEYFCTKIDEYSRGAVDIGKFYLPETPIRYLRRMAYKWFLISKGLHERDMKELFDLLDLNAAEFKNRTVNVTKISEKEMVGVFGNEYKKLKS